MSTSAQTNEFSIVLVCDGPSGDLVLSIRDGLPESPYYDSQPHMTLIRGIHSKVPMSDSELVTAVRSILTTNQLLKTRVTPKKIANGFNHVYKTSSAITIKAPHVLKLTRRKFIKDLESNGFSVELIEKLVYLPHITIRLGVPLRGQRKMNATQQLAQLSTIGFSDGYIFRIYKQKHGRSIRAIKFT